MAGCNCIQARQDDWIRRIRLQTFCCNLERAIDVVEDERAHDFLLQGDFGVGTLQFEDLERPRKGCSVWEWGRGGWRRRRGLRWLRSLRGNPHRCDDAARPWCNSGTALTEEDVLCVHRNLIGQLHPDFLNIIEPVRLWILFHE